MTKLSLPWIGAFVAITLLLPLVTSDQYVLHIAVLVFIYIGITVAWNILAFAGILSLGHAAFFGLGAYTLAILYVDYGVNPWIGILAGGLVAGAGSLVLAIPVVRLRGPFFTLATLAFVEVLRLLAIWAVPVTKGSVGITTPADEGFLFIAFNDRVPYYYIVVTMAFLAIAGSIAIYRTKLGYHLRAISSDEEAVRALGVKTGRLKVLALAISAAITGVFGAFAAVYLFVIDPDTQFDSVLYSIQPALNGIIGGMGTIAGPIVGAIVMTPLGEWLKVTFSGASQGVNFMIYGVVLVIMVRALPGGLVDGYHALVRRLTMKKPEKSATVPATKSATGEKTTEKENER